MNYPYTSGIVKSLENKILDYEKVFKLSKVNKEEFVQVLNELDFGSGEDNSLEEAIHYEMKKTKQTIDSVSPQPALTNLFYLEQDNLNIKLIYKSIYFKINSLNFLSDLGSIDKDILKEAIIKKNYNSLNKKTIELLKEIDTNLSNETKARDLSIAIDKSFYKYAISVCKGNNILSKYYSCKIDNCNILMVLRTKMLNWNSDDLKEMLIDGGTIPTAFLVDCYTMPNEVFVKELSKFYNEKLSVILNKYFNDSNLSKLEMSLEQLMLSELKEFKNDPLTIGPLLYYYLEKQSEIKNIRFLYSNMDTQLNELISY